MSQTFGRAARACAVLVVVNTVLWADAYQDRLEQAVTFHSTHHYAEAVALLRSLTESNPDRKDAYLWLGHARSELQDWSAAREAYKKYADLAPRDVEGPRGVARTYEEESNRPLALLWYRQAADLEPGNDKLRQAVNRLSESKSAPVQAEPNVPEKSSGEKDAETGSEARVRDDFWEKGLAGLVGGRSALWARAIAVVIYGMWLLGSSQGAKNLRVRAPGLSAGAVAFQMAFSSSVIYSIYWGIPIDWTDWGLMGCCALFSALVGRAVWLAS